MTFRTALATLTSFPKLTLLTTFLTLATLTTLATFQLSAQNLNTTFRSKTTYPGQTLGNVWGYESNGREYALIGASQGIIITDVTNPAAPVQIVQIPGPNNLWKEIKTYNHYAYITSEGGQGIQIVNLAGLPSPSLPSKFYTGDGPLLNQVGVLHALHIDETKGFLYAWGGPLFGGGAKIFDLKPDPYNPVYVGKYDQLGYIHDGYVDNDTMYSSHIYAGQFAIVNMANKSAPELINTQSTPGAFNHNTWLTDDRQTIFATDEVNNSFLSAWDVSDPTDIKFLDKIQSNPGSGSMVHNTYIRKNWAVTSWYQDGFTIVDITRPDNLIQVGNHDTYAGSGGGSAGCWGVYHNFTSGTIIASNISVNGAGELWVLTPNYVRACYLEGKITEASTGLPIHKAKIRVIGTNPLLEELTALNGEFKTGQEKEGFYNVHISKRGFQSLDTIINFQRGVTVMLNVALKKFDVGGFVIRHSDGLPVQGATVWIYSQNQSFSTTTDAAGAFLLHETPADYYNFLAFEPAQGMGAIFGQPVETNTSVTIELFSPYRRDAAQGRQGEILGNGLLRTKQNPFDAETVLEYEIPDEGASLLILNSLGQVVETQVLSGTQGQITIGSGIPSGIYSAVLKQGEKILGVVKLIKE